MTSKTSTELALLINSFFSPTPAEPFTVKQCTVPQYWGINFQPPDLGDAAPQFIGADMEIVLDSDGFCETFTTIGSAIAGRFALISSPIKMLQHAYISI